MNAKDFKLSVLDRAIEIVHNEELHYAYSCFAIAKALGEEAGTPDAWIHYSPESKVYESFAESHFKQHPPERKRESWWPYWWSKDFDEVEGRYAEERVAFMTSFRNWLVEQGAQ